MSVVMLAHAISMTIATTPISKRSEASY